MSKPILPALLLLTFFAALEWYPCAAQPPDADNAAVINRLIGVMADPQAKREQRINASLAVSKEEYRKQAGRAIGPMIGLLDELKLAYGEILQQMRHL